MMHIAKRESAFTIVELLVVIVVIGILAAITIVSYTGVAQKATIASLESDLVNASKLLKMDQITNSNFPTSLSEAYSGQGINASPGTTLQYYYDNNSIPQYFCINAIKGSIKYRITNDNKPELGDCLDNGLVLDLDAGNGLSYSGAATVWNDLSGWGNNGSLINGVGYTEDGGGALSFDGVNDYVEVPSSASISIDNAITLSAWTYNTLAYGGTSFNQIIGKGMNDAYSVYWGQSSGIISFRIWLDGINRSVNSVNTIGYNVWKYLVFVYDGSTMKIYQNGILDNSISVKGKIGLNSLSFEVGKDPSREYYFKGNISNVRIHNRATPESEIQQNFNNLRGRYGL